MGMLCGPQGQGHGGFKKELEKMRAGDFSSSLRCLEMTRFKMKTDRNTGLGRGNQHCAVGTGEAELMEYGKSPHIWPNTVPSFSEMLPPAWRLLRRASPGCWGAEQKGPAAGPPKHADTDALRLSSLPRSPRGWMSRVPSSCGKPQTLSP